MKLATLVHNAQDHPAVLSVGGELLDLVLLPAAMTAVEAPPSSVKKILTAGQAGLAAVGQCLYAIDQLDDVARQGLRDGGILISPEQAILRPPVPDPGMILSVGLNYGRHLDEMKDTPRPENPAAFTKTPSSLTGSGTAVTVPRQCPDMIDFEGELTFVFGRRCYRVRQAEALDYVAGYTIANDISARDWVGDVFAASGGFPAIHAWERNVMGKNLPGFTPCGPYLVTRDEIADPHALHLETRLNGEIMQSTGTDDLIFKIPELIAYYSQWYCFEPGDMVTTGSPAGVGFGRDPQVFMKPGDVVEIEISSIGTLRNELVAE